jgi:predicted DNA-binding transcriptional regulator AlpA
VFPVGSALKSFPTGFTRIQVPFSVRPGISKSFWRRHVPFSRSLLSAAHFCDHCRKETQFLPLHSAIVLAGVSRSTMYYWMERRWIHWRESPSGRRLICEASLSRPMREPLALSLDGCGYHQGPDGQPEPVRPAQNSPNPSENVRNRPIR